ncbi:MAG: asparagine synthetase B [Desulfovibrio sp.]
MSRLAGFLGLDAPRAQDTARAAAMLDGVCPGRTETTVLDQGGVAWRGRGPSRLFADGGLTVVLDGVLFNRRDFPPAASDAACFADLYRRHGFVEAMARVNASMAVVLYDRDTGALWLGRDHFGTRPLYYAPVGRGWAFASRPLSLLRLPGVERRVDPAFVALYAAMHYRFIDNRPQRSPYAAVAQAPAAHAVRLQAGAEPALLRYWDLADREDFDLPEATLAGRYRGLFLDAVRLRLEVSPAPAFTLSGGMDSSSILASALSLSKTPQSAFSAVYEDKTFDESDDIRAMGDRRDVAWNPVAVGTPDVVATVAEMVAVHDEPVGTATWLSHYLLCRRVAAAGHETLFSGLGGDELNAGEYEYFFYFFADLRHAGRTDLLEREIAAWARHHDHPLYRKTPETVEAMFAKTVDFGRPGRILPEPGRLTRYHAALDRNFFDIAGFVPVLDHPFASWLKNKTYQDIFRETAPCCLRAEDRQCMAFGLENRLPFFDHRLAEFMFRIPGTLKIRHGVTKHLLRTAMAGILPDETRLRVAKTGWNAPAHVWFSGDRIETLLDLVRSRRFRERGIYDPDVVERLIREHQRIVDGRILAENHMMFLWQLVNLELWLRWHESLPPALETP